MKKKRKMKDRKTIQDFGVFEIDTCEMIHKTFCDKALVTEMRFTERVLKYLNST